MAHVAIKSGKTGLTGMAETAPSADFSENIHQQAKYRRKLVEDYWNRPHESSGNVAASETDPWLSPQLTDSEIKKLKALEQREQERSETKAEKGGAVNTFLQPRPRLKAVKRKLRISYTISEDLTTATKNKKRCLLAVADRHHDVVSEARIRLDSPRDRDLGHRPPAATASQMTRATISEQKADGMAPRQKSAMQNQRKRQAALQAQQKVWQAQNVAKQAENTRRLHQHYQAIDTNRVLQTWSGSLQQRRSDDMVSETINIRSNHQIQSPWNKHDPSARLEETFNSNDPDALRYPPGKIFANSSLQTKAIFPNRRLPDSSDRNFNKEPSHQMKAQMGNLKSGTLNRSSSQPLRAISRKQQRERRAGRPPGPPALTGSKEVPTGEPPMVDPRRGPVKETDTKFTDDDFEKLRSHQNNKLARAGFRSIEELDRRLRVLGAGVNSSSMKVVDDTEGVHEIQSLHLIRDGFVDVDVLQKSGQHALVDYNMQLMLLDQQNEKRQMMQLRMGNDEYHATSDHDMKLMLLEQQNKKRLMMQRAEQDGVRNGGTRLPTMRPTRMPPSGRRPGTPIPQDDAKDLLRSMGITESPSVNETMRGHSPGGIPSMDMALPGDESNPEHKDLAQLDLAQLASRANHISDKNSTRLPSYGPLGPLEHVKDKRQRITSLGTEGGTPSMKHLLRQKPQHLEALRKPQSSPNRLMALLPRPSGRALARSKTASGDGFDYNFDSSAPGTISPAELMRADPFIMSNPPSTAFPNLSTPDSSFLESPTIASSELGV